MSTDRGILPTISPPASAGPDSDRRSFDAHRNKRRRLVKEAEEREWRVFLTAKFDRTWKAMIRFRAKVGANRFRELMAELSSTIDNIDDDQGGVAEFFELLGPELFARYQAELVETLETASDPGAFWAKWIDVVAGPPPETDEPKKAP